MLSDSHGRAQTTHQAARLLVERGAQMLIHLGDVGSVEVIDAMAGLQDEQGHVIPVRLVFGNTDWDAPSLQRYAQSIDVTVDHPAGCLKLAEACVKATDEADPTLKPVNELFFTHGDDHGLMQQALARGVRYLCHGHTHRASDTMQDRTRIINPGALFRAQTYTVAILDTLEDKIVFYPVGEV